MHAERVVEAFLAYLQAEEVHISRAEFERNLAEKERHRGFMAEIRPLLAPEVGYDAAAAVDMVRREFVTRLPGAPWKGGRKRR